MAAQDAQLLAAGGVPQPRGLVIGRGQHPRPVGREHRRDDRLPHGREDAQLLAAGGVPQPRGLVPGRGQHPRPVGREHRRGPPARGRAGRAAPGRWRRPTAEPSCPRTRTAPTTRRARTQPRGPLALSQDAQLWLAGGVPQSRGLVIGRGQHPGQTHEISRDQASGARHRPGLSLSRQTGPICVSNQAFLPSRSAEPAFSADRDGGS